MTAESHTPIRLLLVEDDVRLCKLVKEYLEGMGYQVSLAHTGTAGLEMALEQQTELPAIF